MNVVMTARRPARRGAGDRRARPVLARAARRAARPRRGRHRGDRRRAAGRGRRGRACLSSRLPRRCCGCCSPPGSAARSGSSASCATTRPASARTCSSRSARALFTLVSAYALDGLDVLAALRGRLRPDPDRGADRDRDRLPRRRRDHPSSGISVRGLTTAATLWVVAAIGMAAGTGYYAVGVGAAVLVLVSLWPLKLIATRLVARVRPEEAELAIKLVPDGEATRVLTAIEERGGRDQPRRVRRRAHGRRVLARLPAGGVGAASPRRSTSSTTSSACNGGREGPARLREPAQAGGAAGRAARLGARAARARPRLSAGGRARPTTRTRARRRASAARRPHRTTGCSARTRGSRSRRSAAGRVSHSARWAARRRRAAARRARRRRRSARPLRLRARRARPGRRGASRHRDPRGDGRDERRGDEGFGYDPIFVPAGEERTVAELGNDWKRANSHRARAAPAL